MPNKAETTIGQKITTLVMDTSTVVLLLFLVSAVVIQTAHFRATITDKLFTLANVVGLNIKESLTFTKKWETQRILDTIAAEPSIEVASIFDRDNEVIAHYLNKEQSSFAAELKNPGFNPYMLQRAVNTGDNISHQSMSHITVYVPVIHNGKHLGCIFIQTNNKALLRNLLWFILAAMLILGVALGVAFLLTTRLQKQITNPLHTLTWHMNEIIQDQNYSAEPDLPKSRMLEINELINNFITMLYKIQEHEHALKNHSANLEHQVKERTQDLENINAKLEATITELHIAKEQALQASETKSKFLANISHEIRTPMIGVLGMAELLQKYPLAPNEMELVDTIYNSGEALLTLLNDILDISKIEAGKLELELKSFSPAETIDTAVEVLADKAFSKGLELTVVLDPCIPTELYGDATRLRQIILNLVSNAVKFTHYGQICVSVHCMNKTYSHCTLQLKVKDTGIGIRREAKEHIFDAFAQADSSTSRQYGGTGLGLTIIRQLCELMEGDIEISDNTPHGSIFTMNIPFKTTTQTATLNDLWCVADADINAFAAIIVASPNANLIEMFKYHFRQFENKILIATTAAEIEAGAKKDLLSIQGPILLCIDSLFPADCQSIKQTIENAAPPDTSIHAVYIAPHERILRDRTNVSSNIELFLSKPLKSKNITRQIVSLIATGADSDNSRAASESNQTTSRAAVRNNMDIAQETSLEQETADTKTQKKTRGHILVAEDQPINRRLVQLVLEQAGFTLTMVNSGIEALEHLNHGTFDLVLMDCQMPEKDGYEATRELRRQGLTLPVIAMTAHVCDENIQRCNDAGMDAYLGKPFKNQQLIDIVTQYISSNQG